jgi:hypothetical protein
LQFFSKLQLFLFCAWFGNVTVPDASLSRGVELCFTPPLAKLTQCIFAASNLIGNVSRNERHASSNLFARSGDQTRSAEISIGFLCLGGKYSL